MEKKAESMTTVTTVTTQEYTAAVPHSMAPKDVYIAVIGYGGVGKVFLSQLEGLAKRLECSARPTKLSLILLSRSTKTLYHPEYQSIPISAAAGMFTKTKDCLPLPAIIEYLSKAPSTLILVDNTSSQDVADRYPEMLSKGINIVTPNKKAFSGTDKLWQEIFAASDASGAHVFHESSVGAGLPIISTLKMLVDTGDEVTRIEGVFSGTMSFLFNSFAPLHGQGGKWSAEVAKAKELGYTEPDPRDDLNGLDVARKLTILARMVGVRVDGPTSFPVQSLIPTELESAGSGEEFMTRLHEFDSQMEDIKIAAEKEGKVVRFVGSIDVARKEVKVGLEKFDPAHPIAALKGSDNIISFHTKRCGASPMVVQGAGAGGDITAMGVTGDLIKVLDRV